MSKLINVTQSSMPTFEEYADEIKELWDSHWLTNMGVKHVKFEEQLRQYLNVPNIALFVNGHLALELAIAALNIKGDVITTPFTFASTTQAIIRNGLNPIFCDINAEDYTIDADKIEALITSETSAIIPVHVYGNLCDVNKIEYIAQKYNIKVIYDSAHAFGVSFNGVGVGCFGDASMFSFHAAKVFNTIEGGAVAFKDEGLKNILESLKNFGIANQGVIKYVGINAKMNEFQAAMGICNLRHVEDEISKRRIVTERYTARLNGIRGIKLLKPQKNVKPNYAYFPVMFDGYRINRDEVYELLKRENLIARKYFSPLTNSLECYRQRFNPAKTPVAKYVEERVLAMPLYADLGVDIVDKICDVIEYS